MSDNSEHVRNFILNRLKEEYNDLTEFSFCDDEESISEDIDKMSALYDKINVKCKDYTYDYTNAMANMKKNRYANILASDATRYKLPNDVYINADVFSDGKYILSQGPMNCAMVDFLQMVWDNNTGMILCLTSQVENGIHKYDPYFVDSQIMVCGHFRVWVNMKQNNGSINIRTLMLEKFDYETTYDVQGCVCVEKMQTLVRNITHIEYTEWSDNKKPNDIQVIWEMYACTRKYKHVHYDKIIIHCSAGVGRSGTVLVIFELLDKVQKILDSMNPCLCYRFDIPKRIIKLRKIRQNLVNSVEQLEVCYLATIEGIKKMLNITY